MYIVTFYSFKGGVGRTMTLVNVALDLVRRGRRVLIVDFDLEAPGLDTFQQIQPATATRGLIDFIRAYLNTGMAPSVESFVYDVPHISENGDGMLWVMPSGEFTDRYANRLARIDWRSLYRKHDGFLLMEYLRNQWAKLIRPDYVLVDSRTGHTDVGGICTRQLPQSVVVLFFPNDQNLRGLTKIVRDIRAENREENKKSIDLHFVMSNVPDLDDEDRILEDKIHSFKADLGFDRDPLIIHRYDSLSLLNQVIFTRERPRSRLAREYRDLTGAIIRLNPEDRHGVLEYLASIRTPWRRPVSQEDQKRLDEIEKLQGDDGQIMYQLGKFRAREGRFETAVDLYKKAIDADYDDATIYVDKGLILRDILGDPEGASHDAAKALRLGLTSLARVRQALSMLAQDDLGWVANSRSVIQLSSSQKIILASELNSTERQAELALRILSALRSDNGDVKQEQALIHYLVLASMAVGEFARAVELIEADVTDLNGAERSIKFNYAMARWARDKVVDGSLFEPVLQAEVSKAQKSPGPNYWQCLAVAYWAIGEPKEGLRFAGKAINKIKDWGRPREFSCWQYLNVPKAKFVRDVEEMTELFAGREGFVPRFMKRC